MNHNHQIREIVEGLIAQGEAGQRSTRRSSDNRHSHMRDIVDDLIVKTGEVEPDSVDSGGGLSIDDRPDDTVTVP